MSERDTREIKASAFRARASVPLPCGPVRIKHGALLPAQALPVRPVTTDSAVGPRRLAAPRPAPAPRVADPEYERRLEELAASLLAPAAPSPAKVPGPTAAPDPLAASASPHADGVGTAAPANAPSARPPAAPPPEAAPAARRERPRSTARRRQAASATPRDIPHQEPWLGPSDASLPEQVARPPQKHKSRSQALAVLASLAIVLGVGTAGAWWALHPELADGLLAHAPAADRASGASGTGGAGESSADTEPPPPPRPAPPEAKAQAEEPVIVAPPPAAQSESVAPDQSAAAPERADNNGTAATQANSVATTQAPQPKVNTATAAAEKNSRKEKDKAKKQEKARQQDKAKKLAKAEKKARRQERAQAAASLNRDDEIERLRGQAYSESSRERSRRTAPRPPGEPLPPSSSNLTVTPVSSKGSEGKHSSISKELAQCQKLDGVFFQERCKWRICGEQWGQHGCPSFPRSELRF